MIANSQGEFNWSGFRGLIFWLLAIGIFLSLFGLRIPLFVEELQHDETWFLASGRALFLGGPYAINFMTNPALSLVSGVFLLVTGYGYTEVRLGVAVLTAGCAVLLTVFGWRQGLCKGAVLGGLIFLALMGIQAFQGHYFTKELLCDLVVSGAFLTLVSGRTNKFLFATGCLFGLGFVFRQTAALYGAAALLWLIHVESGIGRTCPLKRALWMLVGCIMPFFLEFVVSGLAGRLQEQVLYYWWLLSYGKTGLSLGYVARLTEFVRGGWPYLLPLFAAAVSGLVLLWRRSSVFLLMTLWSMATLVEVAVLGNFFSHYLLMLFPPLSILAGYSLMRLIDWACRKSWKAGTLIMLACGLLLLAPSAKTLLNYFNLLDRQITLDDFRRLEGMGIWTKAKAGPESLLTRMAPGDRYFALSTHLYYYLLLGPGVLDRVTRSEELFPEMPCALWSETRRGVFFDYQKNQRRLLDIMQGLNPPEWIGLSLSDCLKIQLQDFPDFFRILDERYEFVLSTGQELLFRLAMTPKGRIGGTLPVSVFIRTCRLHRAYLENGELTLMGNLLHDQGVRVSARYILPEVVGTGGFGEKVALEDVPRLPHDSLLRQAIKALGITVKPVQGFIRPTRPGDFLPGYDPSLANLALLTGISEPGERVFIEIGSRQFEGFGVLGRLFPLYQATQSGMFLFDHPVGLMGEIRIYVLGNGEATIYSGQFVPPVVVENLPMECYPDRVSQSAGFFQVEWRSLAEVGKSGPTTISVRLPGTDESNAPASFFNLPELVQRYLLTVAGWKPAIGLLQVEEERMLLPKGNGHVVHAVLFRDGAPDYVGPDPDGIHRQLGYVREEACLRLGRAALVPGGSYTLYIAFDSGRVLAQRIQ